MRLPMTMKRPLLARLMAGALVAGATLHGVPAQAIGLLAAYEAALKNDQNYRSAYYENEAAKENKVMGRAGLLPNVAYNYSGSRIHSDLGTFSNGRELPVQHPEYFSRNSSITLRQTLFNLDAVARYKQSIAQVDANASQFTGRTYEATLRVVSAYIDTVFAIDQRELAQAARDTLAEQQKVNDRMFQKGEGTRTDMIETQARLDVAEAQLIEAQDNVNNAQASLAGLIGAEVGAIDPLAADFALKPRDGRDVDAWLKLAQEKNPEIRTQRQVVEIANQDVNKARAGHTPRIDLVGTYSKSSNETLQTVNQDSTNRSVGVQLSIPLYSGGAVNASMRQAVANREKAKASLQASIDKTGVEVRKEYRLLASSAAKVEALVKMVSSNQLLIKATEQSIKGGVRVNLDLLNAQQQLFTAKRDLAQARYNYLLAGLRLKSAAGVVEYEDIRELAAYFH
ncbi:MAG: TolC family outer membrane protein [Pseudomonadota bacterium]